MINTFFLQKNICRGIFMMAGLFVFLHAYTVQATCTTGDDYSSAYNNYGGFYNASNHPNFYAFAALDTNGHITTWGDSSNGGTAPANATTDTFTAIYSTISAFAALDTNGHITAWGNSSNGGTAPTNATTDTFTAIYSTESAFAALDTNGHITAWGNSSNGGTAPANATTDTFTAIYSTSSAFAALDTNGHITTWGSSSHGGTAPANATTDTFTAIYSTISAFAALDTNGHITTWGGGGTTAPANATTDTFTAIYSNFAAFAALDTNGHITTWGSTSYGGTAPANATTDTFTAIYSNTNAFAALDTNGHITIWGNTSYGGTAPTNATITAIYSTINAFAALDTNGHITTWGISSYGGTAPTNATTDTFTAIYSNRFAFAALDTNGHITTWGDSSRGGTAPTNATTDTFTAIYSAGSAFAALDTNGHITAWGDSSYGGIGAPTGTGYTIPYGGSCTIGSSSSPEDIIIPDPQPSDIQDTVTEGQTTVDNGTIDNTTQVTTQVNVTVTSNNGEATFPTGTIITEQNNGNFNFENFTISDATVENSIAAVDLGIPNTNLSFSQDITVNLNVGTGYNGATLAIYSQSTGQTDWSNQGSCVVSEGICSFTTDHATVYTVGGNPAAQPIDINVEVQDTLTLDCFDTTTGTGDLNVTLGTAADPGKVTAGTPAVGQSTCTVTTNDDQGYYLTIIDDNAAANTVLTHDDPNTATTYEIQDLTQFPTTTTWNAPTTKGLGFSVITFPDTQTANNTIDDIWTNTSTCPEGAADTNDYAGIPDTAQTISAVTQYESLSTTTNICYKVDVPASQASGQYTGSVTYTATSDASSYLN